MKTTQRLGLATLSLLLAPLAASANPLDIIPPFKVNFTFRFNIYSTAHPQPTAPWWAYFPKGAHEMAPSSGPVFPHWPAQFPPAAQPVSTPHVPPAGPNVVFGQAAPQVQPVGYQRVPLPGFGFDR